MKERKNVPASKKKPKNKNNSSPQKNNNNKKQTPTIIVKIVICNNNRAIFVDLRFFGITIHLKYQMFYPTFLVMLLNQRIELWRNFVHFSGLRPLTRPQTKLTHDIRYKNRLCFPLCNSVITGCL